MIFEIAAKILFLYKTILKTSQNKTRGYMCYKKSYSNIFKNKNSKIKVKICKNYSFELLLHYVLLTHLVVSRPK